MVRSKPLRGGRPQAPSAPTRRQLQQLAAACGADAPAGTDTHGQAPEGAAWTRFSVVFPPVLPSSNVRLRPV